MTHWVLSRIGHVTRRLSAWLIALLPSLEHLHSWFIAQLAPAAIGAADDTFVVAIASKASRLQTLKV
jgi:hypothetical protein